jgi:hypothetical protein
LESSEIPLNSYLYGIFSYEFKLFLGSIIYCPYLFFLMIKNSNSKQSNSSQKTGFYLSLGGGGIGLLVGLWAPFVLMLPNIVNFIFLSFITLFVGGLLLFLSFYLFKILKGFMKAISFLVFFGFLQFMNGIMWALSEFDEFGFIENISPYFDYNIFILMPIFFALGFIPMFISMFYSKYVDIFVREKVIKNGYRVSAKIFSLKDTIVRNNKRRIYEIELELNVPSFGNYRKVISTPISLLEAEKFKVGCSVQVAVDRKNKNNVFIL